MQESGKILTPLKFLLSAVPDDVGQRVRALRKEKRWSQGRLAERAGLSLATIGRLEGKDSHSAQADTLFRIAEAFDLPIGDLVPAWPEWEPIKGHGVGEAVRERRRALGMTMAELAEIAGVSEATLSRFERGIVENSGLAKKTGDDFVLNKEELAKALGFIVVDDPGQ